MQPRGIFSGERILLEEGWHLYVCLQQAREENCMATLGGSQVAAQFSTREKNKFSKNKGEGFGIIRANKWVRVRQSFPKPPRRRDSAKRRSSARATPKSHIGIKVGHPDHWVYATTSITRATPTQQRKDGGVLLRPADNNSSTRRHQQRAHPRRGHLNGW